MVSYEFSLVEKGGDHQALYRLYICVYICIYICVYVYLCILIDTQIQAFNSTSDLSVYCHYHPQLTSVSPKKS